MPYKVIFLIISKKNDRYNYYIKDLLSKFFDLYSGNVKYFFIENRNSQDEELIECDHHIYINNSENDQLFMNGDQSFYPSVYKNTIKALKHIETNYDYDYVIKTNINIFWNMDKILKYLDCIPSQNYSGGYLKNGIISSDCIIMSKDVGEFVSSNYASIRIADNYIISNVIKAAGIQLTDLENYIVQNSEELDRLYTNHQSDIKYIITLLKNIYNIEN